MHITGGKIVSLFNDALPIPQIIVSNRMIVSNELEKIYKEAIVEYFTAPYQHLLVGTVENHKNPQPES
jgi:predicted membrane-bound spermidine synthase